MVHGTHLGPEEEVAPLDSLAQSARLFSFLKKYTKELQFTKKVDKNCREVG